MDWFKHDIPAWMNGTESLNHGQYRVYHVICQLIYLHEGPIKRNERGIAGRCNMHILALRTHLDHLIALGKLTVNLDGTLDQPRANLELTHPKLVRGRRRKLLKNNDSRIENRPQDKTRQDKKERISSSPSATMPLLNGTATILSIIQSDWPNDYFEQFWQAYPKHVDKQAAVKKLAQIKKGGKIHWRDLIDGTKRYAENVRGKDQQFTKGPASWLNNGKWEDDLAFGPSAKFDIRRHIPS